jgi:hypothetical protein
MWRPVHRVSEGGLTTLSGLRGPARRSEAKTPFPGKRQRREPLICALPGAQETIVMIAGRVGAFRPFEQPGDLEVGENDL